MATLNNQLNIATVPLPVYKAVLDLSSAQILSMYTTPVFMIAAPGAHKVVIVIDGTLEYNFGGTAYASGGEPVLQYGSTGSGGATTFPVFFNSGGIASTNTFATTQAMPFSPLTLPSDMVNMPIYATNLTANFTTGNGTMRLAVTYIIVSTTA